MYVYLSWDLCDLDF